MIIIIVSKGAERPKPIKLCLSTICTVINNVLRGLSNFEGSGKGLTGGV